MKRYRPKYFEVYEILPPDLYTAEMYDNEEARERGYLYFDVKLLITMDVVREIIGKPLICNTWYMNGDIKYAGFRSPNCRTGSAKSQHKLGRAIDLVCHYYSAEEMRHLLEKNKHKLPYPIRVERGVKWLHIDLKNDGKLDKIIYFQV